MTATPKTPDLDPERLKFFEAASLVTGSHRLSTEGIGCALNHANRLIGGSGDTDDVPACMSPAIGRVLIRLNDRLNDADRQKLKPYIIRALGTRDEKLEPKRRWLGVNLCVREFTPIWLERAGLTEHAAKLRALPELTAANYFDHTTTIKAARIAAWKLRDEKWGSWTARRTKIYEAVRQELLKKNLAADDAADAAAAAAADAAADAAAAADADAAAAAAADAAAADAAAADDAAAAAAADAADDAAAAAAADPAFVALVTENAPKGWSAVYAACRGYFRPKFDALWKERLGADYGDRTNRALALLDALVDVKG